MPTAGSPGRLIPNLIGDGPTQMAIDAMLLDQATQAPVLRFYHWDGPWLSLGRHQRNWPQQWDQLALEGRLRRVRRPSGGQGGAPTPPTA